jgi:hypothetical protein
MMSDSCFAQEVRDLFLNTDYKYYGDESILEKAQRRMQQLKEWRFKYCSRYGAFWAITVIDMCRQDSVSEGCSELLEENADTLREHIKQGSPKAVSYWDGQLLRIVRRSCDKV